uniref:Uncharacterized protein n=1 Tax=Macrostomum lignano TaxID=282301 RepID=A0A1I8IYK2_9PLAT
MQDLREVTSNTCTMSNIQVKEKNLEAQKRLRAGLQRPGGPDAAPAGAAGGRTSASAERQFEAEKQAWEASFGNHQADGGGCQILAGRALEPQRLAVASAERCGQQGEEQD